MNDNKYFMDKDQIDDFDSLIEDAVKSRCATEDFITEWKKLSRNRKKKRNYTRLTVLGIAASVAFFMVMPQIIYNNDNQKLGKTNIKNAVTFKGNSLAAEDMENVGRTLDHASFNFQEEYIKQWKKIQLLMAKKEYKNALVLLKDFVKIDGIYKHKADSLINVLNQ